MAFVPNQPFTVYDPADDATVDNTLTRANSYGTVSHADDYFMLRLDAGPWLDLEDITGGRTVEQQKQAALVSATRLIESLPFVYYGDRAALDQALSFPRSEPAVRAAPAPGETLRAVSPEEVEDYDLLPDSYKYEDLTGDPPRAAVPNRVIAAQFEQALHLLSQEGILLADAQPGQIKLGELAITNPGRVGLMSPRAVDLLSVYSPEISATLSFAWGNDGRPLAATSITNISSNSISSASARIR